MYRTSTIKWNGCHLLLFAADAPRRAVPLPGGMGGAARQGVSRWRLFRFIGTHSIFFLDKKGALLITATINLDANQIS